MGDTEKHSILQGIEIIQQEQSTTYLDENEMQKKYIRCKYNLIHFTCSHER